jgi:hypothetical protein
MPKCILGAKLLTLSSPSLSMYLEFIGLLRGQAASMRKPNTLHVIERKPFRMVIMVTIHILMYIYQYLEFIGSLIAKAHPYENQIPYIWKIKRNYTIFNHKILLIRIQISI